MKIEEIKLKEYVLKTLKDVKKYVNYTPIQEKVIPLAISNKNIIGISTTGSGKSDAFLVPIMEKIDLDLKELQAIVVTPTRELAMQIFQKAQDYQVNQENLRVKLLTGGFDKKRDLSNNSLIPHLIIGTPARLKDILIDNASYNISTLKMIVIDEIDMVFEMKFLSDVDALMAKLDRNVQTLAFSATLSENIKTFVKKYMASNELIQISKKDKTAAEVKHYAIPLKGKKREEVVLDICKSINPYLCLIFSSKKENVKFYYDYLSKLGFNVGLIHGDLDSRSRRQMMKRIENNDFGFVVASDIAARGIDLEGVSHVISVDFPHDLEFYFHRAGRSGRSGNEGISYCLYDEHEVREIEKLENGGIKFTYATIKNGEMKIIAKREKRVSRKKPNEELDAKISKVVNINKTNKVKPNYKKKVKTEIEKIKKDYRRQVIKDSIKKQKMKKRMENSK